MSELRPPIVAEWFAETIVSDRALCDAALGDLAEDFATMAQSDSIGAARGWYWSQVARSVLPLSIVSLRLAGARGWLRLIASVVLGYVVLVVVVVFSDGWLMDLTSQLWLTSIISLLAGAAGAVTAGYVAAAVGGRAPMLSALALGLLCVFASVLMLVYMDGNDGSPLWYRIALMLIVLPACALGAMLRARRLRAAAAASDGKTIASKERE